MTVSHETFEKEKAIFRVFVGKDDAGNVTERKYKLNNPIVRRARRRERRRKLIHLVLLDIDRQSLGEREYETVPYS